MRFGKVFVRLLPLFLATGSVPAAAQLSPAPPDPLARIREASKANATACSTTGESLCEQVAPKIIENAMGESPLSENLRRLTDEMGAQGTGTPATARAVAWGVAAFRDAGVEVHTEKYNISADGRTEQENVVAEIRGREKPEEWVLLGAHIDSGKGAAGALDKECNAALVIEAARDIARTGIGPRRSIRFVLFTGEEQSMPGSWAYVRAHRPELDRARAAIIFGEGFGRVTGYRLNGRHDIEAGVRDAMKPIESLGAGHHAFDAPLETGNFDFLIEGVPTLIARQDINVSTNHQGPAPETVDMNELKRNTAIAAVTAFGIAERAEPLGPRQSRAQIESLLKSSALDQQMKVAGLWQFWESGERGRLP
jgi:acetylornithine deacetylase/succinyl-diaminopimelate desuccinylase-like protein